MTTYTVQGPSGKNYTIEGPEGATADQLGQAILSNSHDERAALEFQKEKAQYDPTNDMGTSARLVAGFGRGMASMGRAVGQLVGVTGQDEIDEAKRTDAALMNTTAGKWGNGMGIATTLAPLMAVPGMNTYAGAAGVGALTGAVTTEGGLADRVKGAAAGQVGGIAGKGLGDTISAGAQAVSSAITNKLAQRQVANAGKDAALAQAQQAGYVVTPAMSSQPGAIGTAAEAIGGKIKTQQLASVKNQAVTNDLVKSELGIAPDKQISREVLDGIRKDAGTAYSVIRSTGTVNADAPFVNALQAIGSKYQGAAQSFPGLTRGNPVQEMVDSLNQPSFTADAAVDAVSILRDRATAAYRSGDTGQGKAAKAAANALEDMLDRHAQASGLSGDSISAFRTARQTIAKSHSVEGALNDATGDVSARALGNQINRGKPLSGNLKTAGDFANSFRAAAQDGVTVPKFSVLDAAAGAYGAGSGNLLALGLPLVRPAARSVALSRSVQNGLLPSYQPNRLVEGGARFLGNPQVNSLEELLGTSVGIGLPQQYALQR